MAMSIKLGPNATTEPSDFEVLAAAIRSLWQGLVPLQIGIVTDSPDLVRGLRLQLEVALPRGYRVELHQLRTATEAFGVGPFGCRFHVVVFDRGSAERVDWSFHVEPVAHLPEVILLDVSGLVADRIRNKGLVVSKVMGAAWSCDGLAREVLGAGLARFALRHLGRSLVGCVPLRDALYLLRHSMVAAALAETRSKSSAARRLGVTRPAIQNIVREMALDFSTRESVPAAPAMYRPEAQLQQSERVEARTRRAVVSKSCWSRVSAESPFRVDPRASTLPSSAGRCEDESRRRAAQIARCSSGGSSAGS